MAKCNRCGKMAELFPIGRGRDWACLPCKMRGIPQSYRSGETLQVRAAERDAARDIWGPLSETPPTPVAPAVQRTESDSDEPPEYHQEVGVSCKGTNRHEKLHRLGMTTCVLCGGDTN